MGARSPLVSPLLPSLVFAWTALAHGPAAPGPGPGPAGREDLLVVGRPAPPLSLRAWLGEPPGRRDVETFRGEVLVVHTFAWNCSSCLRVGIPLAVDLAAVAGPRGLAVVSVTTPAAPEETRTVAETHGIEDPIALEVPIGGESPYVDVGRNPITYVFVVGRNGELVWRGDPSTDLDECLEAVGRALDAPADLALERTLHEDLDEAATLWFEGDFAAARKKAGKLADLHGRRSGEESTRIAADAEWLVARADRLEAELVAAVDSAFEGRDAYALLRAADRLQAGFPRSEAVGTAEERLDVAEDDEAFEAALDAARAWRVLERERPPLFPRRRERAEKRWARDLADFLEDHAASPWHDEGRSLLAAWEAGD